MDPLVVFLDFYNNESLKLSCFFNDQCHILHNDGGKIITLNWLKPKQPTVAKWIQK